MNQPCSSSPLRSLLKPPTRRPSTHCARCFSSAAVPGSRFNAEQRSISIPCKLGSPTRFSLGRTQRLAKLKIGKSVSQALGLEKLGVSLQNLHISGGSVGFGRYLTKGLHVSVAQDLTKKGERKVSMEYQLSPNWQIDTSSSSGGASEAHLSWQKKY